MGTIERDLMECCSGCDSNKVTERKKSMERLLQLLEDKRTIKLLDGTSDRSSLTWDSVFTSVHRLILKEADRFRAEEQKAHSSSAQTNRDNMKLKCSHLIDTLVKKSLQGTPKLKCSVLVLSILDILKDGYLQKCFGCTYLLILKEILRVRKYWGYIKFYHWNELLDLCFMLYEKPPNNLDKATMADILYWIVKCGTPQSHLGLQLRKKFPLLVRAFENSNLEKLPALQASLLKLAITVSRQLAKESRMATCKFGEDIIKYVILLYEHRLEDRYDKKGLMFDFLLLQMHLHHPHGSRECDGAAYAYNWEKWQCQLKSIYGLVDTEMHNIQRNRGKVQVLKENFLKLAVEICKQVFEDSTNVLDVTTEHTANESMSSSVPKRRRVVGGIEAVIEILRTPGKTQDIWPWLSLMSSLFSKYPYILKEQDFMPLLLVIADLQSSCKDSIVMGYLCQCCESLLKVEKVMNQVQLNEKELNLLWSKIWDTTLRAVGLNQSERSSHKLMQAMILHQKVHQPLVVIHMLLNRTIQLSEHSLQTLLVILNCCDIPETLEAFYSNQSKVPSYQTANHKPETLRCALLDWLLPNKEDFGLTEMNVVPLMSRLLVELIVKSQCDMDDSCVTANTCVEKFNTGSIEDDYMISCFEMDLPIKTSSSALPCTNENSDHSPKRVITSAKCKLIELLERDCSVLTTGDVMSRDSASKLKVLTDYISQCVLILSTLSWMLKWSVIAVHMLPTFGLTNAVKKMMAKLNSFARKILLTARMETDLHVVFSVLHKMRQLYEVELHDNVMELLQGLTSAELLDAVYSEAKINCARVGLPMELNRVQFSTKEDGDDVILDSSEEASCSLLDVRLLTKREKVQTEAVGLLCSYSCCFTGDNKLSRDGSTQLTRLMQLLLNRVQLPSSVYYFQMAVAVTRRAINSPQLEDDHVRDVLRIIQTLCKNHSGDHEASVIIQELLCDLFRHLQDGESRDNSLVLLKAYQKIVDCKKYGPEVSVQYIKCLGVLAVVDSDFQWATWNSATPVDDNDVVSAKTPVAEEVLIHVRSPFHEVRMAAVNYISTLFGHLNSASLTADRIVWQKRMFEKLCVIIMSSFTVEGDLTMEEKVDESANRTASALHCFAVLIVVSPLCRKKALFAVLQLVKEKNLNTELVRKVLVLVGKSLKLPKITNLMESNLNYILVHWMQQRYALQDFPWTLLDCMSDTEFLTRYQEVIVPILLQREEADSLELVSRKIGKSIQDLVEKCFARVTACVRTCVASVQPDHLVDEEVQSAKRLSTRMTVILSENRVTSLLNHQLDRVIVNIMRLLFDPQHFDELCGVSRETLCDPDPPYFRISTVLTSLMSLQHPGQQSLPLTVYLSKERPDFIQKILLSLAVDIHQAPTLQDKLKSFHDYAAFAHILVQELSVSEDGLGVMTTFIIRDVSHTLMHLMKQSYQKEEFPLVVASCHFYKLFCSKCFPVCASVVEEFLIVIVNTLVPFAKLNGDLGAESQALLRFLVVENSKHLPSAIAMLDPFPSDIIFEEMREVYTRIVNMNRRDSLEESIRHFLNAGNKNLGCRAEGLKYLRTQVC